MSEYIIKAADWAIDYKGESLFKGCEEIVRCRDCKWLECYEDEPRYVCRSFDRIFIRSDIMPDGFCAWASRRES